jgi:hypothetical protein
MMRKQKKNNKKGVINNVNWVYHYTMQNWAILSDVAVPLAGLCKIG